MKKYKTYPPSRLCVECGGACCKRMPGNYSPRDFKDLSFEGLKAEIEKGFIAIDWLETHDPIPKYYLRARHHHENVVNGSWGGECLHLTETGCNLPWEERPLACKTLKPSSGDCINTYLKEECAAEWMKYDDVLLQLVDHFQFGGYSTVENDFLEFLKWWHEGLYG